MTDVKTQMLIRRPRSEVFEAFVDPAITTRFWFTKSSGRLETGTTVTWEWEMYGASTNVVVKEVEKGARILIEWDDPASVVEWTFTTHGNNDTLVHIAHRDLSGTPEAIAAAAVDSMGGFTLVLAGLKAVLEHDLDLNLIGDHNPEAVVSN